MNPAKLFSNLTRFPGTWLALAVVAGLEWAFFDWFSPGLLVTAGALALGAGLLALWPILLVRSPAFVAALARVPAELSRAQQERVAALREDLDRLGSHQGVQQLKLLRQKIDNLADVLRQRLDAGEITYARYLGTAEQVYLAALDNLHEAAVALTSTRGIDERYIARRVGELEAKSHRLGGEDGELESLYQRRALLTQQQHKVAELLGENERAMTVLDNTAAALAGTRTRSGHAAVSSQDAVRELEQLAGRLGRYAQRD